MSLNLIKESAVELELTGNNLDIYSTASLTLPYGCNHSIGFMYNESRSSNIVSTSGLYVPEHFQHNGIATRLLKAGLSFAKANEVNISMTYVSSPYALMARRSIFGVENITVCNDDTDATPSDLNVDDAIEILERSGRDYGFVVVSSLIDLDTTGWEPVLVNKS